MLCVPQSVSFGSSPAWAGNVDGTFEGEPLETSEGGKCLLERGDLGLPSGDCFSGDKDLALSRSSQRGGVQDAGRSPTCSARLSLLAPFDYLFLKLARPFHIFSISLVPKLTNTAQEVRDILGTILRCGD